MSAAHESRLDKARVRAMRLDLGLSQGAFATLLRKVGAEIGEPNRCTKRLVQKWEWGEHVHASGPYQRAFEQVTGKPFESLCKGHDVVVSGAAASAMLRRADRALADLEMLRRDLSAFLK